VDYVKDHIILNNIRQIAPDPIVFLLSLTVLLRAWTRRPTTQPTEELGTDHDVSCVSCRVVCRVCHVVDCVDS
jgi:hypothetical protein